jgi:hypothetical protein
MVVAALVLATLLRAAPAALDQARSGVLVVVTPETQALSRRLQQEIESLGLKVRVVTADAQASSVDSAADTEVAVLNLQASGSDGIELTVVDRQTGKASQWHVPAGSAGETAGAELLATRTVELLRATLLELREHETRGAAPTSLPAAERAPPPPPPPAHRVSMWLGPAALYSATFRPGAELHAALVWMPVAHAGLSASVLAPLVPLRLGSPQGSVELFVSSYRLALMLEPTVPEAPVALRCSLGVELEKLRLEGHSLPPYRGQAQSETTWGPLVALAPRFRVRSWAHVLTELSVSWPSPQTVVRIADREVTTWGRPLGTVSLGLELSLPL